MTHISNRQFIRLHWDALRQGYIVMYRLENRYWTCLVREGCSPAARVYLDKLDTESFDDKVGGRIIRNPLIDQVATFHSLCLEVSNVQVTTH